MTAQLSHSYGDTQASFDEAQRLSIGKMLLKLFDHWQLKTDEQLRLLGYSPTNRRALSMLQSKPFSNDQDKLDRAGLLLGIHKNLRLLFPGQPDLLYGWITRPNLAFQGMRPLDVMLQYHILGLHMVKHYLDVQRGQ